MARYYAGIGSRRTPPNTLALMTRVADRLAALSFTLRSGGAQGADLAFETGAGTKQIFMPSDPICPIARILAATVHPRWDLCSEYARCCHARNCYQVLGRSLHEPVDFVVCWTPCGSESEAETSRETGGTRTAIVLADRLRIPVFNLFRPDALGRLKALLPPTQGA